MSILGIDYGSKKIGLAKSVGTLAVPLVVLGVESLDTSIAQIKQLCLDEGIEQVVIGLPTGLSGVATAQTQEAQQFVDKLKTVLTLPIATYDERFSTQEASKLMAGQVRPGTPDDAVAAMVMLQSYLDAHA